MSARWEGIKETGYHAGVRAFRRVNPGDVTMHNPWTGDALVVHSFKHKNYWWHRGRRERSTMIMAARLLTCGDSVVEIGGHIGYLTQFFASMVAPTGHVDVFEPGQENLRYLKRNVTNLANVTVREEAVSDRIGTAVFYEEDFSGQNNSLLDDMSTLTATAGHAGISVRPSVVEVPTVTLDSFSSGVRLIDFIKIDVEGAELLVLGGAADLLTTQAPIVLMEVSRGHDKVVETMLDLGYVMVGDDGSVQTAAVGNSNHFYLHKTRHEMLLRKMGIL